MLDGEAKEERLLQLAVGGDLMEKILDRRVLVRRQLQNGAFQQVDVDGPAAGICRGAVGEWVSAMASRAEGTIIFLKKKGREGGRKRTLHKGLEQRLLGGRARGAGGGCGASKADVRRAAGTQRARIAEEVRPVAEKLGCSVAQLALAWTLINPNVSTAIMGASSLEQLEDNLGSLDVVEKLTDEVLEELDEILQNKPTATASGMGRTYRQHATAARL